MRICTLIIILSLVGLAPVTAGDLISEPHALVYYQLPFSGNAPDTRAHFGLRLDRTVREAGQALDYRDVLLRPAVADLRFGDSGIESFTFAGVDYLAQYRTMQADEAQPAEGDAGQAAEKPAEKAAEKPAAKAKPAEEKEKLTMDKVMHSIPTGYFIGAGIGALLIGLSAHD
ncbi:MAG: hypothetical protein HYR49_01855 [Gammaproteobacteria bacterium]|nr:hypothetical protein [Gammaproteobacteria bacterium]